MFQRVALSTAANMCKKLPSDAADFVMEAVPLLTNLLQYHDAKVCSSFLSFNFKTSTTAFLFSFPLHDVLFVIIVGFGACFCMSDTNC